MSNYTNIKKQLAEKEKKLDKANKQTNKLDNTTKDINQILDNLKPAKFNKNNMVISNEDIQKIKDFTKHWEWDRISLVDRNIMRVAVYEMLFDMEVPPVVSINEGVEIARDYSDEKSANFINGVLNAVKDSLDRPER